MGFLARVSTTRLTPFCSYHVDEPSILGREVWLLQGTLEVLVIRTSRE